jgi:hypothetical protein
MFPWSSAKRFAQRAAGALGTARAYLQLENDSSVDWEVDGDARSPLAHPHRRRLRGRFADRRAGQPAPAPQVCLTPVGSGGPAVAAGLAGKRFAWRASCAGGDAQWRSLR